ncbi:MAG TPA: PLP-dependent aminotransferase family protein [Steroidobacteraceae bacterium]|nr:PLP-dependent aminotransferase family protein [Steroidobacteraceae bacterium]
MTSQEPVFEFPLSFGAGGGAGSLVRQLHAQLRAAILDRRLLPGAKLPATRRVAHAYGLARNTVIAAYDLLVAEGYVLTRAGAKAEVAALSARLRPRRHRAHPAGQLLNPYWRRAAPALAAFAGYERVPGFRLGMPECRDFPCDIWRRLLTRAMNRRSGNSCFEYPGSQGRPLLRAAISQHVSFTRAVACTDQDVFVTHGAQQAFDLLARALVTPGRTRVAVENPGYPPLCAAMAAAGAQIVPVAVDEQGLRVERLPDDVRAVYVTPSHQFPTGVPMSMARRAALLDFARTRGAVIIEDDYDGEFRYGERPLDALQTLDREASVFYVGTFSKSLYPALRVGYIVAPSWARSELISVKQCADTGGNSQLQEALGHFIVDGHLARYVRRMRKVYEARRRAVLEALAGELAPWLQPLPSEAGIHIAARCLSRNAAASIYLHARQHAPGAQPLRDFTRGGEVEPGITFGFGCIEVDAIRERLRAFGRALARGRSAAQIETPR